MIWPEEFSLLNLISKGHSYKTSFTGKGRKQIVAIQHLSSTKKIQGGPKVGV